MTSIADELADQDGRPASDGISLGLSDVNPDRAEKPIYEIIEAKEEEMMYSENEEARRKEVGAMHPRLRRSRRTDQTPKSGEAWPDVQHGPLPPDDGLLAPPLVGASWEMVHDEKLEAERSRLSLCFCLVSCRRTSNKTLHEDPLVSLVTL